MSLRPVVILPPSWPERWLEALSLAGLLLAIGLSWYYWPQLPASIPSHFDLSGRADAWDGKAVLAIYPLVATVIYGMLRLIERFPQHLNYPWPITEANAARQYLLARQLLAWLRTCCIWLMAGLVALTVHVALQPATTTLFCSGLTGFGGLILAGLTRYFFQAWRAR